MDEEIETLNQKFKQSRIPNESDLNLSQFFDVNCTEIKQKNQDLSE
jgi:hypothetical protein